MEVGTGCLCCDVMARAMAYHGVDGSGITSCVADEGELAMVEAKGGTYGLAEGLEFGLLVSDIVMQGLHGLIKNLELM